jgi:hypothetical protein
VPVLSNKIFRDKKGFLAVYYLFPSSISIPPILLAKALYRSAAIAPIISAKIPGMIGKIMIAARLKISTPSRDFSNPIDTPKSANMHPQKRLKYDTEQRLNFSN